MIREEHRVEGVEAQVQELLHQLHTESELPEPNLERQLNLQLQLEQLVNVQLDQEEHLNQEANDDTE